MAALGDVAVTSRDHDQVEDEGYIAAEAGRRLDQNPYPSGTLRYEDWRRGWTIKQTEIRLEHDHHAPSVAQGATLADNPHPRGTIRFEEWRRTWMVRQAQLRRAKRLGRSQE